MKLNEDEEKAICHYDVDRLKKSSPSDYRFGDELHTYQQSFEKMLDICYMCGVDGYFAKIAMCFLCEKKLTGLILYAKGRQEVINFEVVSHRRGREISEDDIMRFKYEVRKHWSKDPRIELVLKAFNFIYYKEPVTLDPVIVDRKTTTKQEDLYCIFHYTLCAEEEELAKENWVFHSILVEKVELVFDFREAGGRRWCKWESTPKWKILA